jgi:SAM-dependent methyltransferase
VSQTITACRACNGTTLTPVLDLGTTPLANALLAEADLGLPEERYPLVLVFCPACSLVQITETVPPEILFREYVYFSSFSDTMVRHAAAIAERLTRERRLGPASLVVEVASNDGYLLQHYRNLGVPVLGIEPATNIAKVAEAKGIPTRCDFFSQGLATVLTAEGVKADIIHGNNVLAHVADLQGFVAGLTTLLADDGLAVLEFPYLKDMLDHVEFDTIYHEHLCYFSLTALSRLFHAQGLRVVDVERLPIHGGSLRLFATPLDGPLQASDRVGALLDEERAWGVQTAKAYEDFGRRVTALGEALRTTLGKWKAKGKRIVAYGASAKGSTLLNVFGIGGEWLDYVVDRSTVKQGRYTPGTHLPIRSPEVLLSDRPDAVLMLTWNFADEILQQQAEYRRQGGTFIVPVPDVQEIGPQD